MTATRAQLVDEARTWLGTPYRHQGRVKGVGVDCIGLIGMTALTCGVPGAREWREARDMHNYPHKPHPPMLLDGCARFLERVRVTDVKPADVLLFKLDGEPRHFAMVLRLDPIYVIHAYALLAARRVVEQSLPIARATTLGAFQLRGVE